MYIAHVALLVVGMGVVYGYFLSKANPMDEATKSIIVFTLLNVWLIVGIFVIMFDNLIKTIKEK